MDAQNSVELYMFVIICILGAFTIVIYIKNWIASGKPIDNPDGTKWRHRIMLPNKVIAESRIKRAAAFKMNRMVTNAFELSGPKETENTKCTIKSHFGNAMYRFEKMGDLYEDCGGFLWAWRSLLSETLATEDGIWIHARLITCFMCLVLLAGFILVYGLHEIRRKDLNIIERYIFSIYSLLLQTFEVPVPADITETYCGDDPIKLPQDSEKIFQDICVNNQISLENLHHLVDESNSATMDEEVQGLVQSLVRTTLCIGESTLLWPLIVGTSVSFLFAMRNALEYIPSYTKCVLQLRSGVVPTFHDFEEFSKIRVNPNQVTILTGYIFWGAALSTLIVFHVVTFGILIFVWEHTQTFILKKIVPPVLGVVAAILIKRLLSAWVIEGSFYLGLFRRSPFSANLSSLFFETSSFVLSVFSVLSRFAMLNAIIMVHIGRVDLPVLSSEVEIGPVKDRAPYFFRADILVSDAHRHPYMELLGSMYLMKLRHGANFGSAAGSTWRLIFLYALMPWLSKFRIKNIADAPIASPTFTEQAKHAMTQATIVATTAISPLMSLFTKSSETPSFGNQEETNASRDDDAASTGSARALFLPLLDPQNSLEDQEDLEISLSLSPNYPFK